MNAARPPAPRPGRHRDDDPSAPGAAAHGPGERTGAANPLDAAIPLDAPNPMGAWNLMDTADPMLDDLMVERLLRGEAVDHPDLVPLRRLLGAAAAAGTPAELARAESALAAFAARPRPRTGLLARLLGVKAAAVLIAATATGGLALAAGTGVLPTPLRPRPGASHPATSMKASPGSPGSLRPSPAPSGPAGASLAALCAAFSALPSAQREKALDTPAYADLKAAAGSADRVKAYCDALPAATPSVPAVTPSHHTTGKPAATGKPTVHPSHPTPANRTR